MRLAFVFLYLTIGAVNAQCPDQDAGLALWSDPANWQDGKLPSANDVVIIDSAWKLDVPTLDVSEIRIIGNGKLVFSDDQDISIVTHSILVQDTASLIIGSHSCRFQHDVSIKLIGIQTPGRVGVGDEGEKYIVVKNEGNLQIHGKEVLPFTKLSATADMWKKFSDDANKVKFSHKASENAGHKTGFDGPKLYIFDQSFTPILYKAYAFIRPGKEDKEQKDVDNLVGQLDSLMDGDIVAIAMQNCWGGTSASLTALDDKIQSLVGATSPELRLENLGKCDAYAFVFQKGGDYDVTIDQALGKVTQHAMASIAVNGFKVTAVSHVVIDSKGRSEVDFRIVSVDLGYPTITVVDDLTTSSWKVGDEVLLTSTDFEMYHAEVRTIKEITYPHTIILSDELDYRHFGKIENNVDMRAEVAHLNRNIKFEGEVQRECPPSNGNCDEQKIDTFGAHLKKERVILEQLTKFIEHTADPTPAVCKRGLKIMEVHPFTMNCLACLYECTGKAFALNPASAFGGGGHSVGIHHGFGSVAIEGVQLTRFGQMMNKGHYALHFHVCGFVGEREALLHNNVIRNSFARAVVVHGTYGTSEKSPGVIVTNNVAYDIFGMCYFVEDGAERGTIFKKNLGAVIKKVENGFFEDKRKPTVFWWTTPEVAFIDNVAAGSDGLGFWMTIPMEVVGPSAALGVYQYNEARHTPLYTFDNNVAHSNMEGGFSFAGILQNENGTVDQEMNYEPVIDPLDLDSAPVKAQLVRLTSYKNRKRNAWLEAAPLELIHYSAAESLEGIQIIRARDLYGQFLKQSIIVGKSKENHEDEDYPDAKILPRYMGFVIWLGPVFVKQVWFDGFHSEPGVNVAGAISYRLNVAYPSSANSNFTELRFGFKDTADGKNGNRVFHGNIDDEFYGYGVSKDGDESKAFMDGDGSLTKCPDKEWKPPIHIIRPEKYAVVDSCRGRKNWKMFVCEDRFGKIKLVVGGTLFNEQPIYNDSTQAMRLNKKDPSDVTYEDHSGRKSTQYLTVLESDKYYYAVQMTSAFRQMRIYAHGVHKDHGVVVGICLPENYGYEDISLRASSTTHVVKNDDFQHVNSIDEVFEDTTMSKVFLDQRIVYVHVVSEQTFDNPWQTLEGNSCPHNTCPNFKVELRFESEAPYTLCFNPTPEELNINNVLSEPGYKSLDCELPASQPEPDWGSGDYYKPAIDGQWGDYGLWTPCCPATTQTRKRLCDNPPPYGGGKYCVGDAEETRTCTEPCA